MLSYLNKHKLTIACGTAIAGLLVGYFFGAGLGICAAWAALFAQLGYAAFLVNSKHVVLRDYPVLGLLRRAADFIPCPGMRRKDRTNDRYRADQ
ncbi:MAG: hypothetical protein K2W95_25235 [Candidatus Obscuribacterales bacterium]|nr:hypothetical protein [Candidatus Obscuribacterales bacterium]